jgi:hypothetical protein
VPGADADISSPVSSAGSIFESYFAEGGIELISEAAPDI